MMNKSDFVKLMRFPQEWVSWGMYPDELFEGQLPLYKPGDENASEHDRNGAFHWWLRRQPTKDELQKLIHLAALDPEPFLGEDLRQYFRKAAAFDDELAALDQELFARP